MQQNEEEREVIASYWEEFQGWIPPRQSDLELVFSVIFHPGLLNMDIRHTYVF